MKNINYDNTNDQKIHDTLMLVYNTMNDTGYDAYTQLALYIITGDKTYISLKNNARNLIQELENEDIVKFLLKNYIK